MLNQTLYVVFESEIEGRKYFLQIPMGAPIGESYDQCHNFLQEIVKMGQNAMNSVKRPEDSLQVKGNDGQ